MDPRYPLNPDGPQTASPESFRGSDRYVVRRFLGGGRVGMVFEAYDRTRRAPVALKTLRSIGSSSLYRLKQEFRSLADISHPNLVTLYELVGSDDGWFVVMEMVKGVDFYRHVRGVDSPHPLSSATWMSNELGTLDLGPHADELIEQPDAGACPDLGRLQAAFVQLLGAVAALHGAGKLHRDLKPSNVLVTSEGRVVLVDFGLVFDADRNASEVSRVDKVMGTAAYVAPEVLAGRGQPTPAVDLYAIGVMLFQGLTGRLPFGGTLTELLMAKVDREAPRPSTLVTGIPPELDDLCAALMARDPARRPTAVEALLRLGQDPGNLARQVRGAGPARIEGRETERRFLQACYDTASVGRAVVAVVRGVAGVGKTSVVEHFLRELRRKEEVTILRGRCHERENVPFKAFDTLADGLRRRLKRLPPEEVDQVLPRRAALLARLFPVLREVVPEESEPQAPMDPVQLRLEAVEVSSELVRNLCREKPVVVFFDDVQWGDPDSARVLAGWLKHLQHSRLLVVLAVRSEDEDASPFLSSLTQDPVWARSERRTLQLEPLGTAIATAVARGMLGDDMPDAVEAAVWLAEESGGNPHLLVELATALRQSSTNGDVQMGAGLEELVRGRVAALPPDAQRLLRHVAIAGRPLPLRVLARAAELGEGALQALAILRGQRLVRTNTGPLGELVEPYHNRVGRAVQEGAPEDVGRTHERLARAMEAERWDDPEALMHHWLAAGAQERAGELAFEAARAATDTLAFDRAARLFRTALELGRWDESMIDTLRVHLAEALVYSGRGEQGARVYLDAAAHADPAAAIELRRKAAEQLMSNGYLDEGLVLVREVLAEVGLRMPGSITEATAGHLLQRVCVAWRGPTFQDVEEFEVTELDRQRIDICWFVALALSLVDPVRGAYFHDRALLYALQSGERSRVLRSLCMELPMRVGTGKYDWNRWSDLLKRCKALANRVGKAHGNALVYLGEGMSAYLEGRFKNAYRLLKQSERTIVEFAPSVGMELTTARLFALRSLMLTGELKSAAEQHARLVDEASERANLLLGSALRSDVFVLIPLAAGNPNGARSDLAAAQAQWSRSGWHLQHLYALRGEVFLALFEGRGSAAFEEVERRWGGLRAAGLHRNAFVNVLMLEMRGAAALGAGQTREARKVARLLHKAPHRVAGAFAMLLTAGADLDESATESAAAGFDRAAVAFDRLEMQLHAQVARRRRGKLLSGPAGAALARSADGWFENQGVADVDRLCESICPSPPRTR